MRASTVEAVLSGWKWDWELDFQSMGEKNRRAGEALLPSFDLIREMAEIAVKDGGGDPEALIQRIMAAFAMGFRLGVECEAAEREAAWLAHLAADGAPEPGS